MNIVGIILLLLLFVLVTYVMSQFVLFIRSLLHRTLDVKAFLRLSLSFIISIFLFFLIAENAALLGIKVQQPNEAKPHDQRQ